MPTHHQGDLSYPAPLPDENQRKHLAEQAALGGWAFAQTHGRIPTIDEARTWEGGYHAGRETIVVAEAQAWLDRSSEIGGTP